MPSRLPATGSGRWTSTTWWGGGLWTSIDLFVGLILGPGLGRLSIPARAELTARFMPKIVLIMPTVVVMTLAAGFQLALKLGNLSPNTPNHSWWSPPSWWWASWP
ncbi:MAG: hypothetical protein ACR2GF_00170 [Acidimicrobiales bacterium]